MKAPSDGAWRSPVARLLWEQEVPGSNPGAPTIYRAVFRPIGRPGRNRDVTYRRDLPHPYPIFEDPWRGTRFYDRNDDGYVLNGPFVDNVILHVER